MAERRWTILIVPEGCDAPRSYRLSERALRRARRGSVAGLVVLLAAGMAVGHALPAIGVVVPPLAAADGGTYGGEAALRESSALRASLAALRDTLASLARRDRQLRLAAGLPIDDSTVYGEPGVPGVVQADSDLATAPADVDSMIRRASALSRGFEEAKRAIARNADKFAATPSIMPTAGWLTSQFSRSRFHPILHVSRPHEGIDLSAPMGAPVVAPAAGTVERVTTQTGYGLVLEIDHGNGIETKYAHLSRVTVRAGARVTRGQVIAAVGNSGLSTGPHLHYEIHVQGRVVDPLTYVLPGAIPD